MDRKIRSSCEQPGAQTKTCYAYLPMPKRGSILGEYMLFFLSKLCNAGVRIAFSLLHSDMADDQLCSMFRGSGKFRHAL